MELFLFVLAVIGWAYGFWQRSKAKEFESLFELSKGYDPYYREWFESMFRPREEVIRNARQTTREEKARGFGESVELAPTIVKFNKDGSIAKKRGPKPKNNKEVK